MKKWVMSRHDSMDTIQSIESSLGIKLNLSHSAQARCEEPGEGVVFVHFDETFVFIQTGDSFIPFLASKEALELFPTAVVDQGAIKFLLNGADVMRPGVKEYEKWGESGKLVVVKEAVKNRPIAVGRTTISSQEMEAATKGVCFKNLHHVGDRFWNLYKTV